MLWLPIVSGFDIPVDLLRDIFPAGQRFHTDGHPMATASVGHSNSRRKQGRKNNFLSYILMQNLRSFKAIVARCVCVCVFVVLTFLLGLFAFCMC